MPLSLTQADDFTESERDLFSKYYKVTEQSFASAQFINELWCEHEFARHEHRFVHQHHHPLEARAAVANTVMSTLHALWIQQHKDLNILVDKMKLLSDIQAKLMETCTALCNVHTACYRWLKEPTEVPPGWEVMLRKETRLYFNALSDAYLKAATQISAEASVAIKELDKSERRFTMMTIYNKVLHHLWKEAYGVGWTYKWKGQADISDVEELDAGKQSVSQEEEGGQCSGSGETPRPAQHPQVDQLTTQQKASASVSKHPVSSDSQQQQDTPEGDTPPEPSQSAARVASGQNDDTLVDQASRVCQQQTSDKEALHDDSVIEQQEEVDDDDDVDDEWFYPWIVCSIVRCPYCLNAADVEAINQQDAIVDAWEYQGNETSTIATATTETKDNTGPASDPNDSDFLEDIHISNSNPSEPLPDPLRLTSISGIFKYSVPIFPSRKPRGEGETDEVGELPEKKSQLTLLLETMVEITAEQEDRGIEAQQMVDLTLEKIEEISDLDFVVD